MTESLPEKLKGNVAEAELTTAVVTTAQDGDALAVCCDETGAICEVYAHLARASHLRPGNAVLMYRVKDKAIMIDRFRQEGERPAPGISEVDGKLCIEASKSIVLKAGKSRVELTADGRIRVDGQEIYQLADGLLRLRGATLEIN